VLPARVPIISARKATNRDLAAIAAEKACFCELASDMP
jgi:hypothetical protein